ncbi:MAG: hypothetical protein JXA09_04630 [Anaerolineae bacterium]|nr:hypothetical protein [Anaerolineae bacterium]
MQVLHPERYHGHRKRPPFFEGWYYKLVDRSEQQRYAVIPGIFLSDDPAQQHSFVQVLDGSAGAATYHRYPPDAFWAAPDAFEVHVGPNRFTGASLSLDIATPERTVQGEVHFSGLSPWPVTLLSPGIMGWYGWIPFMECYHGVLSFDHSLHGTLSIDGQAIDWEGGRGYIEKDWGAAFPSAWVWMQTNHFSSPGISLTASIAMIPWIGRTFRGFIVGLWHDGALYRMATYTGAKVERLEVTDTRVTWSMRDRRRRLELDALRAPSGVLLGPTERDMGVRVPETMRAEVHVHLAEFRAGRWATILEDTGRYAGLEVVGDLEGLLHA